MDKTWIREQKFTPKYIDGVRLFMQFVRDQMGPDCKIRCPCSDCCNVRVLSQTDVEDHLHITGIMSSYTRWIYHGEKSELVINKSCIGDHLDATTTINNEELEDEGLQDMLEDIIRGNIMDTNSIDTYHDRATCADIR